jgi:HlyD family secretion protein
VTLDAIDGRTFRGTVSTVSPAATVSNNIAIFTVTVKIPNPDGALRPGMSAEAEIISQELPNTLLIPKKAVETVRTRSYVQLVGANGQAERHRIRTGPDDGTSVAVTSGLKPGDQVLLPGGTRSTSGSSTGTTRNQGGAFPGPPPGGN